MTERNVDVLAGFPKAAIVPSLREQTARLTLKNVRAQGHTYVELRQEGKRFIFFCTLCLSPCYSDKVLSAHLNGNMHTQRCPTALLTLLASNPWPFNDGVLFFDHSREDPNHHLMISNPDHTDANNLALVNYVDKNIGAVGADLRLQVASVDENAKTDDSDIDLVVPGVLQRDKVSDLELRYIGLGQIAARFREKDGDSNETVRIWCEWLGKKSITDEDTFYVPEHDYAVITFRYTHDLGIMSLKDDLKALLSTGSMIEFDNNEGSGRIRKKFSDPEEVSHQYSSLREDSLDLMDLKPRLLIDDRLLQKEIISNKSVRRELRRQQRVAAEKMCDICQHKMLPGKDVATILNFKTEKLACNSRNGSGAFHVFHVSCLIHWILLCEYEILSNQPVNLKGSPRSKRKIASKRKKNEMVGKVERVGIQKQVSSVFCPECHGTGTNIEGEKLEHPKFLLSELFKYKLKVSDAHRAWMISPEVLPNCSIGFYFSLQPNHTAQEKVSPLKLLHFYSATDA